MEYIKSKLKDKSAQDMIEFTFVLPLLMFCFVLILTGGQLVYNKFVVYNACFNGLRQASTCSKHSEGERIFKHIVEEYYPQTISVDTSHVETKIITTVSGRDIFGHTSTWVKNAEIVGTVKFPVKTLFPVNFSNLKAANIMYVSGKSATYIEYDNSNGKIGDDVNKRY